MLWTGRDGQPDAGQVAFFQRIGAEHLRGGMNWIETPTSDGEGIDAFFFPVPLAVPTGPGGVPSR